MPGAVPVHAQASFSEDFDSLGQTSVGTAGPPELTARGWIFRNQSTPVGAYGYAAFNNDTNPILPPAHGGTFFLGVNDAAAEGYGDPLSVWAILPAIPDQSTGDLLKFASYSRVTTSGLEVRYSPAGGTDTGSGADGTGDFTEILGTVSDSTGSWVLNELAVPGTGRLALRFRGQRAAFHSFSDLVGVDSLTVGVTAPPCNMPRVPAAGENVRWTRDGSPYRICQSVTITAGSTVVAEAGVRLDVDAGRTVAVRGVLRLEGTAADPVEMIAGANYPPMIEVEGGTLQAAFARVGGQLRPMSDGTLLIADTAFNGPNGLIFGDATRGAGFAKLERVAFNDSELTITGYTLVLQDLALNRSTCRLMSGYPFISNLTADGRGIQVEAGRQGTFLDTIAVRNAVDPALNLVEGNFLIGPDVSLTNNAYPVQISSAGILPGSVLPATGNVANLILVPAGDHRGPSTLWSDAGVPYFIAGMYSQRGGSLRILEGAEVRLAGGASIRSDPSLVAAYGTEERPIRFEQAFPGEEWFPLTLFYRIRHAVIDGATRGAVWPGSLGFGFMDSSIVRNCSQFGVTGQGSIKKTLFLDNGTGAFVGFNQIDLNGDTNPNAFEGNGAGVAAAGNARYNWWGSSTGPTASDNPGGTGDTAADGVPYEPFRTVRPDFSDAPPVVDLGRHAFLARPGGRVFLTWKARDDAAILSQRVLMTPDGHVTDSFSPPIVLAEGLPGDERSIEFFMPEPPSRFFGSSNIRVEATDSAGQIGWDDITMYAERDEPGELVLVSPTAPEVSAGANLGPVCWQANGINPIGGVVDAWLLLENTGEWISLGGVTTYLNCLSGDLVVPFVSTDRARIVLSLFTGGGANQPEYYFGPVFAIRPDSRVGDQAPAIALISPAAGISGAGRMTVPIRWAAWDDDSVRAVHVQASLDGGRTWTFIARNLPPAAGAYDWLVPSSTGEREIRIKVVAVDERFQDSADGGDPPLPPGIIGLLFLDSATLSWNPDPSAAAYDIVRGDGHVMHESGSVADAVCMSDDWPSTTWADPAQPAVGRIFYYLVRGDSPASPAGTYNDAPASGQQLDVQAGTSGGTDCGR